MDVEQSPPASDPHQVHFSREDTVERIDNPTMLGLIFKLGGDVGQSSSDESDSEDDEDDESSSQMAEGYAKVWWINGEEATEWLADLRVVDRAFDIGNIVALSSDPLGQTGTVTGVETFVDLEYPTGETVKDVDSRLLRRVRPIMVGDYVVRDYWIGRVEELSENVTILFDDGAKCKLNRADPTRLVPLGGNRPYDQLDCHYYPGLRVRSATTSLLFKGAKWLKGSWKPFRMEGTVVHVSIGSVAVYWMNVGSMGSNQPPSEHQEARHLTVLTLFSQGEWQTGDRSMPPLLPIAGRDGDGTVAAAAAQVRVGEAGDSEEETSDSEAQATTSADSALPSAGRTTEQQQQDSPLGLHLRKHRRCAVKRERKKSRKRPEMYEAAVLISRTRTLVDVVWQDGTKSCKVPAPTLIQVRYIGDNEFWPEHHVIERGEEDTGYRRTGIVKSVNAQQRTATVRWFKRTEPPEVPREFEKEETVSVYELLEHSDFSYCLGDIVIRLPPVGNSSTADETAPMAPTSSANNLQGAEEFYQKPDRKQQVEPVRDLSWTGMVVGLEDGYIEVQWGDGQVSKVGPEEVFVVNEDDESDVDSDEDWETVTEGEEEQQEKVDESIEPANVEDRDVQGGLSISGAFSMLSKLAVNWVSLAKKAAVGERSSNEREEDEDEDEVSEESDGETQEEARKKGAEVASPSEAAFPIEAATINSLAKVNLDGNPSKTAESLTLEFKHFDVVQDASDHYYAFEESRANDRSWLRKVRQEWAILEENLPETIYVRMYEDRMDLMRAVIVGAAGTPYHDGLFVFDIMLPSGYPSVPPVVYYHSGGLRLNPNLYETGRVCLSLLNTWSGKGTELWNAGTSNVLQVLISIQGLVLNAKPYFNEAGYEKQTGTGEGEKNSIAYNENTFLLSCKSMMYLMRRPPRHFEDFVRNHFRARAEKLLVCCKAYLDGVPVGYLNEDGSRPAEYSFEGSAGFKLMLAKLMPRLASVFMEIGAPAPGWREYLEQSPSQTPQH